MKSNNEHAYIESLLELLKSADSAIVVKASVGLHGSPATLSAPALIGLTTNDNDDVRSAAARALGRLIHDGSNRDATVCALQLLLSDKQGFVRSDAIDALAVLRTRNAKSRIEQLLLHDPDPVVRATAAEAQIELGDHTSEEPLRNALSDTAYITRSFAAMAAGLLGLVGLRGKLEELSETDPSPNARIEAAVARYRLGDRRAIETLIKQLEYADRDTLIIWANGASDLVDRKTPPTLAGKDANDLRFALETYRLHRGASDAGILHLLDKLEVLARHEG